MAVDVKLDDKKEEEFKGVKIGEKIYGPQDVEGILTQHEALQESLKELSVVKDAVSKYGIDPQTFVTNAEGAFGLMSKLIDEGVIDNQGNLVGKKESVKEPTGQGDQGTSASLSQGDKDKQGPDSVALAAINALSQKLDAISKTVESVDKTQSSIIRANLEEKIRGKYPILSPDDTSKVIATALRDRSKDMFAHAGDLAQARTAEEARLREKHAKEFGIDLKTFDENRIVDPGNDGGVSAMLKGRKISFRKLKGEDTITPAQAIKDFMKMRLGGA